jgi:hypothetical protein
MWGVLINGIQAAALEHDGMKTVAWNGATSEINSLLNIFLSNLNMSPLQLVFWLHIQLVSLFSAAFSLHIEACSLAMLILYTVAPLLYRLASSTYYNLSLLSSDFYGLLFGVSFMQAPLTSLISLSTCIGLFLYVSFVSLVNSFLVHTHLALPSLLALLHFFCCHPRGTNYLFLALDA